MTKKVEWTIPTGWIDVSAFGSKSKVYVTKAGPIGRSSIDIIQARWLRTFLEYQGHVGRHKYRLLPNAPHPLTMQPTYMGCEKCGKPKP